MMCAWIKGIQGREFLFVGATRGNLQRDPSKSLNPVLTPVIPVVPGGPAYEVDLAHAVMTLNLGLPDSAGLDGEHKWTLGTPVSYIHT